MRQRFALGSERRDLGERMAATLEQDLAALVVEHDSQLTARRLVNFNAVEVHARMQAIERDASPGHLDRSRILQRNKADCAGLAQRLAALGAQLRVRGDGARHLGR